MSPELLSTVGYGSLIVLGLMGLLLVSILLGLIVPSRRDDGFTSIGRADPSPPRRSPFAPERDE